AKGLRLVVDARDAPAPKARKTVAVHWAEYNLPPASRGLAEAAKELPPGAADGKNDWKRTGWGGPCPPIGRHRYFFKLYALDTTLSDLPQPNKAAVEKAMQGHVIAQATLMGTYQKAKGG